MPMNQAFLAEFDQEFANTRKTLERVPDDKWDYKPHAKSGTKGTVGSVYCGGNASGGGA